MALETLCTPALIYLVFSIVQIIVDTGKGLYNTAFLKLIVTFVFTVFLNYLCERGLGVVSWIIVFIPFILMSIIISVLLLMLGLDPTTGKLKVNGADVSSKPSQDPRKIPIYPPISQVPSEQPTGSSLLKNLEDELKDVDYSAYEVISELDKEVPKPSPYPPPKPSPYPPAKPSPYPPPYPNPYNVKNSAPFIDQGETTYYNKLTPENKKIFDNMSTNMRQKFDILYLMFKPKVSDISDFPADQLNTAFIKFINENNN